jgi:hypothetical protein
MDKKIFILMCPLNSSRVSILIFCLFFLENSGDGQYNDVSGFTNEATNSDFLVRKAPSERYSPENIEAKL